MMKNHGLSLLVVLLLSSCATLKPEKFAGNTPDFEPIKFFSGHVNSSGVMEARNGKPSETIATKMIGKFESGVLNVEQDVYRGSSTQSHRSFQMKLIDEHHVEGTGSDITTRARGVFYGNYFTWSYRMKISGKGLVRHANMTQHMYLMPDGKTLIIRSVIRKFGIIVTEITEQFRKDD